MFKFSIEWLKNYCGESIEAQEIFSILNLQGFEFQGKEKVLDDYITEIEVKANRPDMLSHIGIAREINAFKGKKLPQIPKSSFKVNNEKYKVKINDNSCCRRFSTILIKNVDNTIPTPSYIKTKLDALGINSLNAVVDILNYIMFDLGQPFHCYDADKIKDNELNVKRAKENFKFQTLNGEVEVQKDDILILDSEKPLCLAGIIGGHDACVTEESKNILVEAAVFDEVSVRLTSRRVKVSTPSSFRFERGIDIQKTLDILEIGIKLIQEICGGEINPEVFDFYPEKKSPDVINLSIEHANKLLGTDLKSLDIKTSLEKYGYSAEILSENEIKVTVPSHRILVQKEIDLIGEIARVYGYDNIKPIMPNIELNYESNKILSCSKKLREILLNMNFCETINYSFIPQNFMDLMNINKKDAIYGDVILQNPISNAYALMRPTLIYSLLNCLTYNYSIRNSDLALFELGRTYFKDNSTDTGYKEFDTCGFIISGTRIPKGWGYDKETKYDYYDLLTYLNNIMNYFGQKYEFKAIDYKFLKGNTSYEILSNGKNIGFIGEINKSEFSFLKNIKLIKDKIFYCEFYIKDIIWKDKRLKFESKYPPVKRLYNFVHSKNVSSEDVIKVIKKSSNVIREVIVKDIYESDKLAQGTHAVLYEVIYCSENSTLTSEEIEKIENNFINILKQKNNVDFKN